MGHKDISLICVSGPVINPGFSNEGRGWWKKFLQKNDRNLGKLSALEERWLFLKMLIITTQNKFAWILPRDKLTRVGLYAVYISHHISKLASFWPFSLCLFFFMYRPMPPCLHHLQSQISLSLPFPPPVFALVCPRVDQSVSWPGTKHRPKLNRLN